VATQPQVLRPPATAAVVEGTFVVSAEHAAAVAALLAEYRAPCVDQPVRTLVLRRQIQSKGERRPQPSHARLPTLPSSRWVASVERATANAATVNGPGLSCVRLCVVWLARTLGAQGTSGTGGKTAAGVSSGGCTHYRRLGLHRS
jgi:hypothetical protein